MVVVTIAIRRTRSVVERDVVVVNISDEIVSHNPE